MGKKIELDDLNTEVLRHYKANLYFRAADLIPDDDEVNRILKIYFKEHGFADFYEE